MKLSKNALKEILRKCEKRFPRPVGASIDTGDSWAKFCAKKPIEFRGNINGAQYIIRVSNDAYAVCILIRADFLKFTVFNLKKER